MNKIQNEDANNLASLEAEIAAIGSTDSVAVGPEQNNSESATNDPTSTGK